MRSGTTPLASTTLGESDTTEGSGTMARRGMWLIGGVAVGVGALVLKPDSRTWLRSRLGLEPEDRRWFEEDDARPAEHEGDEPLDTREARFSLRARLAEEGHADPVPEAPPFAASPPPAFATAQPLSTPEPAPFEPPRLADPVVEESTAEAEAVPESERAAVPEPELELAPEPEAEAVPEPGAEIVPEPELAAVPDLEPEPEPEPEHVAEPEPALAAVPELEPEPSPEPAAEAEPAAGPDPEPPRPAFGGPSPRFSAFGTPPAEPVAVPPAPPAFEPPVPEPDPGYISYEALPAISPEADAPRSPGEDTSEIEPLPTAGEPETPADEEPPPRPPTLLRPPTSPPPVRPFSGESPSFRSAIDAARERVHGAAREATPDEGESTEPIEGTDQRP